MDIRVNIYIYIYMHIYVNVLQYALEDRVVSVGLWVVSLHCADLWQGCGFPRGHNTEAHCIGSVVSPLSKLLRVEKRHLSNRNVVGHFPTERGKRDLRHRLSIWEWKTTLVLINTCRHKFLHSQKFWLSNRLSVSLRLFCHVPLESDQPHSDWRMKLNLTSSAMGCTYICEHRSIFTYVRLF